MAQKWTKEELNALKKLYPAYMRREITKAELLKTFNRSYSAITRQVCNLNLPKKGYGSTMNKEMYKYLIKKIQL